MFGVSEREGSGTDGTRPTEPGRKAEAGATGDAAADPADRWMRRDDEFLLEADREYVVRDEASWRDWLWPTVFGVLMAVLVGDAITTGVGMAFGVARNPVVGPIVAAVGIRGVVVLKATAAVLLVLSPGVTDSLDQAFRAGCAALACVGLVAVGANAWAVFALS